MPPFPDDDKSEGTDNVFVGVTCLACGLMHFVIPKRSAKKANSRLRKAASAPSLR
jgi:hypothetical protein